MLRPSREFRITMSGIAPMVRVLRRVRTRATGYGCSYVRDRQLEPMAKVGGASAIRRSAGSPKTRCSGGRGWLFNTVDVEGTGRRGSGRNHRWSECYEGGDHEGCGGVILLWLLRRRWWEVGGFRPPPIPLSRARAFAHGRQGSPTRLRSRSRPPRPSPGGCSVPLSACPRRRGDRSGGVRPTPGP